MFVDTKAAATRQLYAPPFSSPFRVSFMYLHLVYSFPISEVAITRSGLHVFKIVLHPGHNHHHCVNQIFSLFSFPFTSLSFHSWRSSAVHTISADLSLTPLFFLFPSSPILHLISDDIPLSQPLSKLHQQEDTDVVKVRKRFSPFFISMLIMAFQCGWTTGI